MSSTVEEIDIVGTGLSQIVFCLRPVVDLSDDQLFELCQVNRELRIERNEQGELIIMSPAGGESSHRNAEITLQLALWAKRDGTGIAFDSSGGFRLPNGAMLSPDAAWLRLSRWNALAGKDRKKFVPLCPDFVIELRSETDRLRALQKKLREYIDNGAELGLLIDPIERRVHVYRRGREVEVLDDPQTVSCDPPLRGFALDLRAVW